MHSRAIASAVGGGMALPMCSRRPTRRVGAFAAGEVSEIGGLHRREVAAEGGAAGEALEVAAGDRVEVEAAEGSEACALEAEGAAAGSGEGTVGVTGSS